MRCGERQEGGELVPVESRANSEIESELENSGQVDEEDRVQSRGLDHPRFCGQSGESQGHRGCPGLRAGATGNCAPPGWPPRCGKGCGQRSSGSHTVRDSDRSRGRPPPPQEDARKGRCVGPAWVADTQAAWSPGALKCSGPRSCPGRPPMLVGTVVTAPRQRCLTLTDAEWAPALGLTALAATKEAGQPEQEKLPRAHRCGWTEELGARLPTSSLAWG